MAAELEEVVVDADVFKAERLGEQAAEDLFMRCSGATAGVRGRDVGRGQRAAVELAVAVSGRRSSCTIADGTM